MRTLILALSILVIIDSAHFATAGLSDAPRETSAPADSAIAAERNNPADRGTDRPHQGKAP